MRLLPLHRAHTHLSSRPHASQPPSARPSLSIYIHPSFSLPFPSFRSVTPSPPPTSASLFPSHYRRSPCSPTPRADHASSAYLLLLPPFLSFSFIFTSLLLRPYFTSHLGPFSVLSSPSFPSFLHPTPLRHFSLLPSIPVLAIPAPHPLSSPHITHPFRFGSLLSTPSSIRFGPPNLHPVSRLPSHLRTPSIYHPLDLFPPPSSYKTIRFNEPILIILLPSLPYIPSSFIGTFISSLWRAAAAAYIFHTHRFFTRSLLPCRLPFAFVFFLSHHLCGALPSLSLLSAAPCAPSSPSHLTCLPFCRPHTCPLPLPASLPLAAPAFIALVRPRPTLIPPLPSYHPNSPSSFPVLAYPPFARAPPVPSLPLIHIHLSSSLPSIPTVPAPYPLSSPYTPY
ncbi:hypothetical protein C8J57DRAFT_1658469 [Mycena rebaudengoi]|nr:hypothetical protein C8J57DRAFT_1658469 [Mycena rebaudengoi]